MIANGLFGYAVDSDFPLARERPAPAHRGVLRVRRPERPILGEGELVSWYDHQGAQLAVLSSSEQLRVWCSSTGWFGLDPADRTITADPSGEPEWWEHRLGSTVVPLLLGELGDLALHAAAVDVGGRALIVCGQSGAGKSTLATALALGGHAVLSEDGVVVSGLPDGAMVWPGLDGVRVAAPTFSRLTGEGSTDPEAGGKPVHLLRRRPAVALAGEAIVFLETRVSGRHPVIERVETILALPALVGHVLCPGRARLPTAMRRSAALLDLLPAFKVALPDDLAALPQHAAEVLATITQAIP